MSGLIEMLLSPGLPDFLDLPWDIPLQDWQGHCDRLEEVPHGLSRHPVVFVNYSGVLYVLKELPPESARIEYQALSSAQENHLPAVVPAGYAQTISGGEKCSVLITRYLENSLPYRLLFMQDSFQRYRKNLLDAIAGLLVQLHLAGFFWGDCSLSNTLFRRDAGALQAYLVDAETAETSAGFFSPALRFHDLQIMTSNLEAELEELQDCGLLLDVQVPASDAGRYIQQCYQRLWEEITREELIGADESFRIQERIRALNELGFSVGDVELRTVEGGSQLHLRVFVTDRSFHSDQLYSLTGLDAEEQQARTMMNEIQELRATLSRTQNRSIPLNVAAYHWLEHLYTPVQERLQSLVAEDMTPAELYYQVLEHKWYLSERAGHDVGHMAAAEDYLKQFSRPSE